MKSWRTPVVLLAVVVASALDVASAQLSAYFGKPVEVTVS